VDSLQKIDLEKYKLDRQILGLLKEQLAKDLQLESISTELTEVFDFEKINFYLASVLEELLHQNTEAFFSSLYRIDVDEYRVREILRKDSNPTLAITEMVIHRELLKVVIKLYYSKQN